MVDLEAAARDAVAGGALKIPGETSAPTRTASVHGADAAKPSAPPDFASMTGAAISELFAYRGEPAPGAADGIDPAYAPASGPTAYNLERPLGVADADLPPPAELLAIGEAMHVAGLPAGIGNEVWQQGLRAFREQGGKPLDDAAIESGYRSGWDALAKQHGPALDETVSLARAVVAPALAKDPRVAAWLESTGLGNSPWLITTLAILARARGLQGSR